MIPGGLPSALTTAEPSRFSKIRTASASSTSTFSFKSKRIASAPFTLAGNPKGKQSQRTASAAFSALRSRPQSRTVSGTFIDSPFGIEDLGLASLVNLAAVEEISLDLDTLQDTSKMAFAIFTKLSPELQKIVLWTLLILSILIVPGFWYAKFLAAAAMLLLRPVANEQVLADAMTRDAVKKEMRDRQRERQRIASGRPTQSNLHIASLQRIPDVVTLPNAPAKKRHASAGKGLFSGLSMSAPVQQQGPSRLAPPPVPFLPDSAATASMPKSRRPLPTPPSANSPETSLPYLPSLLKPQAKRMTSSPHSSAILKECSKGTTNLQQGQSRHQAGHCQNDDEIIDSVLSYLPSSSSYEEVYDDVQEGDEIVAVADSYPYNSYGGGSSSSSRRRMPSQMGMQPQLQGHVPWSKGPSGSYRRVSNLGRWVGRTVSGGYE